MGRQQRTKAGNGKVEYSRTEYIDGSAVRRLEAAPDIRKNIDREEEEQRRREKSRQNRRARQNREKAMRMSKGYVAFLTTAVLAICVTAIFSVLLQSQITTKMNKIASLKSEVENLKADNDATENRLNASVDLDAIKDAAINQLGMVYPSADQIIYYDVDESDYMNQYEDIPSK